MLSFNSPNAAQKHQVYGTEVSQRPGSSHRDSLGHSQKIWEDDGRDGTSSCDGGGREAAVL
jgi:hypothetical protein